MWHVQLSLHLPLSFKCQHCLQSGHGWVSVKALVEYLSDVFAAWCVEHQQAHDTLPASCLFKTHLTAPAISLYLTSTLNNPPDLETHSGEFQKTAGECFDLFTLVWSPTGSKLFQDLACLVFSFYGCKHKKTKGCSPAHSIVTEKTIVPWK